MRREGIGIKRSDGEGGCFSGTDEAGEMGEGRMSVGDMRDGGCFKVKPAGNRFGD